MMDNSSWMTMYPEIVLLVMACVVTLVDLFVKSPKRTGTYVLTLLSLGGVALLHALYADAGQTLYGFGRMVVSDPMGHWLAALPPSR
jgi:NADH-quinone oxidoreductase subunit N